MRRRSAVQRPSSAVGLPFLPLSAYTLECRIEVLCRAPSRNPTARRPLLIDRATPPGGPASAPIERFSIERAWCIAGAPSATISRPENPSASPAWAQSLQDGTFQPPSQRHELGVPRAHTHTGGPQDVPQHDGHSGCRQRSTQPMVDSHLHVGSARRLHTWTPPQAAQDAPCCARITRRSSHTRAWSIRASPGFTHRHQARHYQRPSWLGRRPSQAHLRPRMACLAVEVSSSQSPRAT